MWVFYLPSCGAIWWFISMDQASASANTSIQAIRWLTQCPGKESGWTVIYLTRSANIWTGRPLFDVSSQFALKAWDLLNGSTDVWQISWTAVKVVWVKDGAGSREEASGARMWVHGRRRKTLVGDSEGLRESYLFWSLVSFGLNLSWHQIGCVIFARRESKTDTSGIVMCRLGAARCGCEMIKRWWCKSQLFLKWKII